jgi:hypothetical protein
VFSSKKAQRGFSSKKAQWGFSSKKAQRGQEYICHSHGAEMGFLWRLPEIGIFYPAAENRFFWP